MNEKTPTQLLDENQSNGNLFTERKSKHCCCKEKPKKCKENKRCKKDLLHLHYSNFRTCKRIILTGILIANL